MIRNAGHSASKIALALLFGLVAGNAEAGTVVGQSGSVQGLVQRWESLNEPPAPVTITGTVKWIEPNVGNEPDALEAVEWVVGDCGTVYDGDWNIALAPEPGSSWAAVNHCRTVNPEYGRLLFGWLELEVRLLSPKEPDLRKVFPPGTKVEATGWWTEDFGHDPWNCLAASAAGLNTPKTELHPLISMRSGTEDNFTFFTALDQSGRFNVSTDVVRLPVTMHELSPSVLNIASGTRTTTGYASVLEESAQVDWYNPMFFARPLWNSYQTRVTARQVAGEVTFDVQMKPPNSIVGAHYLGSFHRYQATGVSESFTRRIVDRPDGHKELWVDMLVTLPQSLSPAEARWEYAESASGQGYVSRWAVTGAGGQSSPPPQLRLSFGYSPAAGMNATRWPLTVYGSDREAGWWPLKDEALKEGLGRTSYRHFFEQRRIYELTPSRMQLDIDEVAPQDQKCASGVSTIDASGGLLPGIYFEGDVTWIIESLRNVKGEPAHGSVRVPDDGTWAQGENYRVRRTQAHRIELAFDPAPPDEPPIVLDPLQLGRPKADVRDPFKTYFGYLYGLTSVRVYATGRTELGEQIAAVSQVSAPICVDEGHEPFVAGLAKYLTVLDRYRAKGDPYDPSLPWDQWQERANGILAGGVAGLPAPYKLLRRLGATHEPLVRAYAKLLAGQSLAGSELEAVREAYRRSLDLPPVKTLPAVRFGRRLAREISVMPERAATRISTGARRQVDGVMFQKGSGMVESESNESVRMLATQIMASPDRIGTVFIYMDQVPLPELESRVEHLKKALRANGVDDEQLQIKAITDLNRRGQVEFEE